VCDEKQKLLRKAHPFSIFNKITESKKTKTLNHKTPLLQETHTTNTEKLNLSNPNREAENLDAR